MSNILESQELINGQTQQFLADQWWAKAAASPAEINPFGSDDTTDPRGRRGSLERHENFQSGSSHGVFFLGGLLGGGEAVVRTIVGQPGTIYFAPFANQMVDNTTDDVTPDSGFPGGYALTGQHLADLEKHGLTPRDPSTVVGGNPGDFPTLLSIAQVLANSMGGQFVAIDAVEVTPDNIEDYRQETNDRLKYNQLPRHTGIIYNNSEIFVADPDLGKNLNNGDPNDDEFPTLVEINPSLEKAVVPFVQAGYYFAFTLDSGAHTVHFGTTSADYEQDITYNILNPVAGTDQNDGLCGTESNDYLDGRKGRDQLSGFGGDDLIVGGDDLDQINGGIGSDELWGDGGKDTFVFERGYGKDTIFDLQQGETILLHGFCKQPYVSRLVLPSGSKATQIEFNRDDSLTLVGIKPADLSINLDAGKITF